MDGVKEFTAELTGFENKEFIFKVSDKELRIPQKQAATVRLSFKF